MIEKKRFEEDNMCSETSELDTFISYAVTDCEGKTVYQVDYEGRTLVFDAVESVSISNSTPEGLTDAIIDFIGCNTPDCFDAIECMILKSDQTGKEPFVIDIKRLQKFFPRLGTVLCNDTFQLVNSVKKISVFDPFELGELTFSLEQDGDTEKANRFGRNLWRLDFEWASFFRDVAEDYYRKPEDHLPEFDENRTFGGGSMDDLFRIYFFGWFDRSYTFDRKDGFIADKYKNIEKAIAMIPTRFKNCYSHEIGERLFWDTEHFVGEENPDYDSFRRVLLEAEKHFPGTIGSFARILDYYGCHLSDKFFEKNGDLLNRWP